LDEFLRGLSHHHLNADAALLQQANHFCCLVGCNPAANAEGDLHNLTGYSNCTSITATQNRELLLRPESLVEHLAGSFSRRFRDLRNYPFHFASLDLILSDAARLAGMGFNHWRRSALQLACTPRRHQDVPVIAVKSVHQLHCVLPCRSNHEKESGLTLFVREN